MTLSWFSQLEAWPITLGLVLAMVVAAEGGFWTGRRLQVQSGDMGRGHFNAVQGSLLGLLALLLGFSFNMSMARYETRRQLVIDDANALSGLCLKGSLLPEGRREEFMALLRQYVGIRTDMILAGRQPTMVELTQHLAHAEDLHGQMWRLAREMAQCEPPVPGADGLLSSLAEALAVQRRRVFAFQSRVPGPITGLLFGAALTAAVSVGFSGGLGRHRGQPARILLTLLVSGTIYVILDLDRPQSGLIRVDQTPLLQVKEMLARDADRDG